MFLYRGCSHTEGVSIPLQRVFLYRECSIQRVHVPIERVVLYRGCSYTEGVFLYKGCSYTEGAPIERVFYTEDDPIQRVFLCSYNRGCVIYKGVHLLYRGCAL